MKGVILLRESEREGVCPHWATTTRPGNKGFLALKFSGYGHLRLWAQKTRQRFSRREGRVTTN